MASGLDYRRLDGSTKGEDRVKIVKEFNSMEEVNICLVSTMAGGLGLNFVGANIVILFDPTWNPANDLQAIDRAYRIGQCRDVKVFRLISLGTVEELIYLRQIYKQQLHCAVIGCENAKRYFEAVQGSKEHQGELFGIHNLFRLQDQGCCLTKEILEREGQVEAGVLTATSWLQEESKSHEDKECDYEDQGTRPLEKDGFDWSNDFSDEEQERNVKGKAGRNRTCKAINAKTPLGQLSLLQCGFSKLLEKKTRPAEDDDCLGVPIDENSRKRSQKNDPLKIKDQCSVSLRKRNTGRQEKPNEIASSGYPVSPRSEEEKDVGNQHKAMNISNQVGIVMETEDSSSESEDIIFSSQVPNDRESMKSIREATPLQKHLGSKQSLPPFSKIKSFGNIQNITTVKEGSDVSDESDDIEMSPSGKQTFTSTMKQNQFQNKTGNISSEIAICRSSSNRGESNADSQNIEEYSSSEDSFSVKKDDTKREKLKIKGDRCRIHIKSKLSSHSDYPSVTLKAPGSSSRFQTSARKELDSSQRQKMGSLDGIFDNLVEVSYLHSNQKVVGPSKAENQMSRWAMQDVFELQQFSQIPANVAVCRAKKSRGNPEEVSSRRQDMKDYLASKTSRPSLLYVTHPINQKQKRIHQIGSITFLLGKTPSKIRRKHFEEMASLLRKASVEEFAKYITETTSEDRQNMLKEFYGAKYPELRDLLKVEVPVSVSKRSEKGSTSNPRIRKRKAICTDGQSKPDPSSHLNDPGRSGAGEKEFQHEPSGQTAGGPTEEDKQLPAVIIQENFTGRNSQAFKDCMAFESLISKSRIIEGLSERSTKGQPNSKGTESPRKPSLSESEGRQSQIYKQSAVADLLGDTSILNDLFKSNENSPAERPKRCLNGPVEKAAGRPKDFWDMLKEENEEYLQRLTDVAAIEKLCERAPFVPLSEKEGVDEKSLWKENDQFLWKINDKTGTEDESSSGT